METIAVYWEPVIKTYGIITRTHLNLVMLDLALDRLGAPGKQWRDATAQSGAALLLFTRLASDGRRRLNLLADPNVAGGEFPGNDGHSTRGAPPERPETRAVELVYFQGPHFGDRYGIASAALNALNACGVRPVAMVCSGASVYLMTGPGGAFPAQEALRTSFDIPQPHESRSES